MHESVKLLSMVDWDHIRFVQLANSDILFIQLSSGNCEGMGNAFSHTNDFEKQHCIVILPIAFSFGSMFPYPIFPLPTLLRQYSCSVIVTWDDITLHSDSYYTWHCHKLLDMWDTFSGDHVADNIQMEKFLRHLHTHEVLHLINYLFVRLCFENCLSK